MLKSTQQMHDGPLQRQLRLGSVALEDEDDEDDDDEEDNDDGAAEFATIVALTGIVSTSRPDDGSAAL